MGGVRSGNALGALGGGALGLIGGSLAGGLACGTYAIVKSTPQVLHPCDLIYQDDRRTGLGSSLSETAPDLPHLRKSSIISENRYRGSPLRYLNLTFS